MEIIENLTADGKSVILITHKLKEITASSDQCTIIRQGKYIRTVKVNEVTENDLAAMMVGRDVTLRLTKRLWSREKWFWRSKISPLPIPCHFRTCSFSCGAGRSWAWEDWWEHRERS